jgi:hypothetical protein
MMLWEIRRLKHDPQERDPNKKKLIQAAKVEAEFELNGSGFEGQMGYCHVLWGRQQAILRKKYGIKWRTPAEMNPDIIFD